jgi:hypothetical protein
LALEVDEFREHEDGEGEVVKAGTAVESDSSVWIAGCRARRDDFTLLDNTKHQSLKFSCNNGTYIRFGGNYQNVSSA